MIDKSAHGNAMGSMRPLANARHIAIPANGAPVTTVADASFALGGGVVTVAAGLAIETTGVGGVHEHKHAISIASRFICVIDQRRARKFPGSLDHRFELRRFLSPCAMRRLEHEDEEKFWEAWIKDETIFCFRFGKIGTTGQTRIKRHSTRAEAEADLEDNIQRKLKEGFEEKSEDAEEEEEEAAEEEEEESEDEGGEEDEAEEEDEDGGDDEEDEEEEDEDEDEEEAPKPKKKKPAVAAAPPPPPEPSKPKLPARTRAKPHAIAPEQISAAKNALEALHAGLGKRSWKVRKLARRARQSLERVAGVDPSKHGFGDAFDALMNDVTAAKKRLPLDIATRLLLELDPAVFVRTVKSWKNAAGPAKDTIGVLQTSVAAIDDADVALHVGAAFAERRLDAPSWRKRFGHVKPVLEEALKKKGSTLAKYLKSLDTGEDSVLASHVEEAAR
jgi:predicted DNA-binding WGR domain protein